MGQLALPILGIALSAGGAGLNALQQQQYQQALAKSEQDAYRASKAARLAEQGRQDMFGKEAQGYLDKTQAAIAPEATEDNRTAAEQHFMDLFDERGSTQPEGQYLSGQDQTTDVVKSEIAKRAATAAQDARSRVQALAKIGSFDDAMGQNGLALQGNSSLLNTLGGIRRGSMAVGNQEANIRPNQVFPGDNLLGPLMSAAGSAVSGLNGIPGGFGGFTMNPATGNTVQNWGIFGDMFGSMFGGGTPKQAMSLIPGIGSLPRTGAF